jgi:hypothetical protein
VSADPPLDPARIFDALERREVDHVTVGGLAVGVWAYERATKDTDIVVPDNAPDNDLRLRAALTELDAQPLALEAPGAAALGIRWEPTGEVQRWQTAGGVLDVLRRPEGAAPYPQLRARALRTELFGAPTWVVSRDDLIAMKLAAARVQDLLDLEALLHPGNTEPLRARLRARDRDRLAGESEPAELGQPVDPCEHQVDLLRRVLAPTAHADELEVELVRRARELRGASDERIGALTDQPMPAIPESVERVAAGVAEAAREIEAAERYEFTLVRDRDRIPVWRRRERGEIAGRLDHATGRVDQLQSTAEDGVDLLRARVRELDDWWTESAKQAVEAIAGRRERYRRDREQLAERVRHTPERPSGYITELIGERPAAPAREDWDRAARSIDAYVGRYTDGGELQPPERPDRSQRGAWERMSRSVDQLGIKPPELADRTRDTGPDLGL